MKMPDERDQGDFYICELAFKIIHGSEAIEGFDLRDNVNSAEFPQLEPEIVFQFLEHPATKLKTAVKNGKTVIVATNLISQDSIEINGLGDHFLALVQVANRVKEIVEAKKQKMQDVKILDADFIKKINDTIFKTTYFWDRRGIGNFRDQEEGFYGNKAMIEVDVFVENDWGQIVPSKCVTPTTSERGQVTKEMDELIDWVNKKAFKTADAMKDIAEFHGRFINIHPFKDGNGRTVRLLTNYLLLLNGYSLVNVPVEDKETYLLSINYAMAPDEQTFRKENKQSREMDDQIIEIQGERTEENRYDPLKYFLVNHLTPEPVKDAMMKILNYGETVNGKNADGAELEDTSKELQ